MGIVLASASPRRKRLLAKLVRGFRTFESGVSERMLPGEGFRKAAIRLALAKAKKAARRHPGAIVIGADTISYLGKSAFRKTENKRQARRILAAISGKTHSVVTGVAVLFPSGRAEKYAKIARIRLKKFGKDELEAYLRSGEWMGRTGCYDLSGRAARFAKCVRGERETAIGLPLARLRKILARHA